jgi:hypothetical protein
MSILDKLERRFSRFALPNLTILLVIAQCIGFVLLNAMPEKYEQIPLQMSLVAQGQFWRLGTFFFVPVTTHPLFFLFGVYFFYLMGSTLEANWGDFRYSLYVGIATLATYAVGILFPQQTLTNAFIGGSVFLAFAYLYPGFVIVLFFILPVQIKWLALVTWIGYFWTLAFAPWPAKAMVLAAISNFLLFFGHEIFWRAYHHKRRMEWDARTLAKRDKPFHNCAICGANERTHPKMDFRYCTKCEGAYEYCSDHLATHEHVVKAPPPAAGGTPTGNASGTPVANASKSDGSS